LAYPAGGIRGGVAYWQARQWHHRWLAAMAAGLLGSLPRKLSVSLCVLFVRRFNTCFSYIDLISLIYLLSNLSQ
jgi:hypothetical protein